MPSTLGTDTALAVFRPPYDRIEPVDPSTPPKARELGVGGALVWRLGVGGWEATHDFVLRRPPGTTLILVLPPTTDPRETDHLLGAVENCRPQSILPYHSELHCEELRSVLSRRPADLALELMDYLVWRGLTVDGDTRQILRRIVDLSDYVRTVTGLARAMYVSRRALGRRFTIRGIPVPSHWLHFARLLRVALRLQNEESGLMSIAYDMGYSDGFALSNQMLRLTGIRPSQIRRALGWEWIVEAWIVKELESGGFSARLHHRLALPPGDRARGPLSAAAADSPIQQVVAS